MTEKKFDPKKLAKLNNPDRLKDIPPETIKEKTGLSSPEVLVEIGAGTAFFSRAFQALFRASEVYACDLSDTMLDWMRENVVPEHPEIIPVKNEESALPLDSGMADLVFMITLHHELEHPERMLREAHRLLKPGGTVFIVDWRKQEMPEGPPEAIRCRPEDVGAELSRAGFEKISIHEDLPKHFLVVGKKPG